MKPMDHELHQRWLHDHDSDAFTALVRAHAAMVYATCRRVLGNSAEAEDVAQECFWKFAREARPIGSIPAWLHTVATRLAINRIRAEGRRRAREERFGENAASSTDPTWSEVEPLVDEALAKLPENQRELIVLHYFEGRTHAEIAEREGIAPSTVTRRLQRAVEELRNRLTGTGISAAALIAGLTTETNAAAPPSLHVALVKIALVNGESAAAPIAAPSTLTLSWPAALITAAVATCVLLAAWYAFTPTNDSQSPLAVADITLGPAPSASDTAQTENAAPVRTAAQPTAQSEPTATQPAIEPAATPEELQQPTAEASPTFALYGLIRDREGNPIPGATVVATEGILHGDKPYWMQTYRTRSNGAGEYHMRGLPIQRDLRVTASANDHIDATRHASSAVTDEIKVDMTMEHGVELIGRVLASNGAPLEDALVSVNGYIFDNGASGSGGDNRILSTDNVGRFVAGFKDRGLAVLTVATRENGWEVFREVPIGTGTEQILRLPAPVGVRGVITYADTKPAANLEVHLTGLFRMESQVSGNRSSVSSRSYAGEVTTNAAGEYEFNHLPASLDYEARIISPGDGATESRALSDTTGLGNIRSGTTLIWNYAIQDGMRITGTIVGEQSGRSIEHIQIAYQHEMSTEDITVSSRKGDFDFRVHRPGRYFIYPKIHNRSREELMSYGQWVPWSVAKPVNMRIAIPEPFTIRARILDAEGNPVPSAQVQVAWGVIGTSSIFASASIDDEGRVAFEDCVPGEGLAYWIGTRMGNDYIDAMTTPIVGESGDDYPIETIVLRRAGGFATMLRDAVDNAPLKYARVEIEVLNGADGATGDGWRPGVRVTGETDGNGFYSVASELPEGTLDLRITAQPRNGPKYQRDVQGVLIAPGLITTIETVELYQVTESN